jgi:hypothetical protein
MLRFGRQRHVDRMAAPLDPAVPTPSAASIGLDAIQSRTSVTFGNNLIAWVLVVEILGDRRSGD